MNDPVSRSIATSISRWAVSSQQQARRNAMIAATLLAERRRQHLEVAEYLEVALGENGSQPGSENASQPGVPTQRRSS